MSKFEKGFVEASAGLCREVTDKTILKLAKAYKDLTSDPTRYSDSDIKKLIHQGFDLAEKRLNGQ